MSPAPDTVGAAAVNNTAGTPFGCGRQPGHRTARGGTAVKWAVLIRLVDGVVVLSTCSGVSAAINEAATQAGASPM